MIPRAVVERALWKAQVEIPGRLVGQGVISDGDECWAEFQASSGHLKTNRRDDSLEGSHRRPECVLRWRANGGGSARLPSLLGRRPDQGGRPRLVSSAWRYPAVVQRARHAHPRSARIPAASTPTRTKITSYVSGRDGHRDLAEKLCRRGVVGNESLHSRITISFEFTLHEVRAPAGAGREIGDWHAFRWGRGVAVCRPGRTYRASSTSPSTSPRRLPLRLVQ